MENKSQKYFFINLFRNSVRFVNKNKNLDSFIKKESKSSKIRTFKQNIILCSLKLIILIKRLVGGNNDVRKRRDSEWGLYGRNVAPSRNVPILFQWSSSCRCIFCHDKISKQKLQKFEKFHLQIFKVFPKIFESLAFWLQWQLSRKCNGLTGLSRIYGLKFDFGLPTF